MANRAGADIDGVKSENIVAIWYAAATVFEEQGLGKAYLAQTGQLYVEAAAAAHLRHRVTFEAGQQRVVRGRGRAAAVTANAVDDLRDLSHLVEGEQGWGVAEISHPLGGTWNVGWLALIITPFWIAGVVNAINFTDGLDGLAIVPVMVATMSFAFISYLAGNFVFSEYLQINFTPGTGELAVINVAVTTIV